MDGGELETGFRAMEGGNRFNFNRESAGSGNSNSLINGVNQNYDYKGFFINKFYY